MSFLINMYSYSLNLFPPVPKSNSVIHIMNIKRSLRITSVHLGNTSEISRFLSLTSLTIQAVTSEYCKSRHNQSGFSTHNERKMYARNYALMKQCEMAVGMVFCIYHRASQVSPKRAVTSHLYLFNLRASNCERL